MMLSLILIAALAAGQAARADEPIYTAMFAISSSAGTDKYGGTTTFHVDGKGVVTGVMQVDASSRVVAKLSGSIKNGTWTFDVSYEMPERQCTGTLKGSATVPADRKRISGTAVIGGACVPQPMQSTFVFTRREK